jgi:hypothetical protein
MEKISPESLELFCRLNEKVKSLDLNIKANIKSNDISFNLAGGSKLFKAIKYLKISSLDELETLIENESDKIIAFTENFQPNILGLQDVKKLTGLSVFYLFHIIAVKTDDINFLKGYLKAISINDNQENIDYIKNAWNLIK